MNGPRCITSFDGDLNAKKVFVRAALNVPLTKDGQVDNDFRIQKFLPTLHHLQERGAIVIILAHIGRDPEQTLEPVVEYLANEIPSIAFYQNFFSAWGSDEWKVNKRTLESDLAQANPGDVLVLDNMRQTTAEKENSADLAKEIANFADYYIHEAFPVAHRKHCSTYGLPSLFSHETKFSGVTFDQEFQTLQTALTPETPSLFITGGAKFKTKLPLITTMLGVYDNVLVGGALANNLFKLAGYEVGESLVEELTPEQESELHAVLKNPRFILPEYVTCETESGERISKNIRDINQGDKILDIAAQSINEIQETIHSAKTIVWNGPLGYYEGGYDNGTKTLAMRIGESEAWSVAGGGDTIDAIYDTEQEHNFTFLSSAGGAMIDYLSDSDLPGINVLSD